MTLNKILTTVTALLFFNTVCFAQFGTENLVACAPYSIADAIPADLDNDGDNDILVGCSGSLELAWYENLGDGTFSFAIKVQNSESSVPCVEAADLDGDGDLDVIAGSSGGDRLSFANIITFVEA
mgnify:CR=1 FL=1